MKAMQSNSDISSLLQVENVEIFEEVEVQSDRTKTLTIVISIASVLMFCLIVAIVWYIRKQIKYNQEVSKVLEIKAKDTSGSTFALRHKVGIFGGAEEEEDSKDGQRIKVEVPSSKPNFDFDNSIDKNELIKSIHLFYSEKEKDMNNYYTTKTRQPDLLSGVGGVNNAFNTDADEPDGEGESSRNQSGSPRILQSNLRAQANRTGLSHTTMNSLDVPELQGKQNEDMVELPKIEHY